MPESDDVVGVLEREFLAGGWPYVVALEERRLHETLHLDFTRKQDPHAGALARDDLNSLSKALSGFANAEGGLLVWGVNAKRDDDDEVDCVKGIEPVLSLERFASELRGVSPELVAPALPSVRHHAIANPASPDAGIVVTVIPQSDRAPHMATARGLHRYYRRTSNDIRYLEHYEVADYFGRRPHPRLEIEAGMRISVVSGVGSSPRTGRIDIAFLVHNRGRGLAHFPCISLGKPAEWPLIESPHDPTVSRTLVSQHPPGRWWSRYVAPTPALVIYPDDELDAVHARFGLHHLQGAFPDLRIPVQVVAADCDPIETVAAFPGAEIRRQWQLAMDCYIGA